MSDTGKFAVELAEAMVEKEREAQVALVRAALPTGSGSSHCVYCDVEIPTGRRQAMPAAKDCIACAAEQEARGRR